MWIYHGRDSGQVRRSVDSRRPGPWRCRAEHHRTAESPALNLYAPEPHAFGQDEERRAETFAASVSAALALAARQASTAALTGQLREALASRAVIDQALGIIMAQERCTSAQAFAILRAASQNRNMKLRDIARQTVTSVTGEPPALGPLDQ